MEFYPPHPSMLCCISVYLSDLRVSADRGQVSASRPKYKIIQEVSTVVFHAGALQVTMCLVWCEEDLLIRKPDCSFKNEIGQTGPSYNWISWLPFESLLAMTWHRRKNISCLNGFHQSLEMPGPAPRWIISLYLPFPCPFLHGSQQVCMSHSHGHGHWAFVCHSGYRKQLWGHHLGLRSL